MNPVDFRFGDLWWRLNWTNMEIHLRTWERTNCWMYFIKRWDGPNWFRLRVKVLSKWWGLQWCCTMYRPRLVYAIAGGTWKFNFKEPDINAWTFCRWRESLHSHNCYCILGKTTLADALVASNGIISQRMAGKVVYYLLYLYFQLSHFPEWKTWIIRCSEMSRDWLLC